MICPVGEFCFVSFFCSKLWPNLSEKSGHLSVTGKIHCILESNLGPFAGF